jgi:hypothetical protein
MTVSLPGIERIGCDMDAGRTTATCWFEVVAAPAGGSDRDREEDR